MTVNEGSPCAVEGCLKAVWCRGWCMMHYSRWQRQGAPAGPAPLVNRDHSDGCTIEGCDKPHEARGWCSMHYARWRRWGDPRRWIDRPVIERVLRTVDVTADGCWLWTASLTSVGYPSMVHVESTPKWKGRAERVSPHRFMYEFYNGPIPDRLHLDHLCHNIDPSCLGGVACRHRRCVNPDHLEPVTVAENLRRGRERVA